MLHFYLDKDNIQPPLGEGKNASDNLNLVTWTSGDDKYVLTEDVKVFIKSFFQRAFRIPQLIKDQYISEMYRALRQIEWVNGDSGNLIPDVRCGIIKAKRRYENGTAIYSGTRH